MYALLFIGYCLLSIYGIIKIPFIRRSGIRPAFLIAFFVLHVAAGLLHNTIAWRYFPGHGDIWDQYFDSLRFRNNLLHHFSLFIADNASLTHVTHNGIIAIDMLLNIFSFDNLSIDTLLFSFPVFLGNIALFHTFRRRFPRAPAAALTVFLLPSTLFWTACIHREGVLYMLLGFLIYVLDQWLTSPQLYRKGPFYSLLLTVLILYFRFFLLLSLLPALFIWLLAEKPRLIRMLLPPVAAILILTIVLLAFVFPEASSAIAGAITARQLDFLQLEGNSRLPLPRMTGTWTSIISVFPAAFRNGLFEPLPGSGGKALYWAFAAELLLIWLLFAASLISHRRRSISRQPFIPFCLFLALTGFLIIGAIVPFAGAIVRYRSIFLPFLLAPALYCLKNIPILHRLDNWLETHLFTVHINNLSINLKCDGNHAQKR